MSKKLIAVTDKTHAALVKLSSARDKPIKVIASAIIDAYMRNMKKGKRK